MLLILLVHHLIVANPATTYRLVRVDSLGTTEQIIESGPAGGLSFADSGGRRASYAITAIGGASSVQDPPHKPNTVPIVRHGWLWRFWHWIRGLV